VYWDPDLVTLIYPNPGSRPAQLQNIIFYPNYFQYNLLPTTLSIFAMDPLSVTASILTVLESASALLAVCYDIRAGLRKVPWGLIQIIEETRDLRNIVEAVQSAVDGCDEHDSSTEGHAKSQAAIILCDSIKAPLVSCLAELSSLDAKIKPPSLNEIMESKRKAVRHAFEWHLNDRDVQESLARLERCKNSLNMAINSQNM
jgi:hypothetical protein